MLDDVEVRLECLRLATVLHENDVPDVTMLLATSEALRDYVLDGRTPMERSQSTTTEIADMFCGYAKNRKV